MIDCWEGEAVFGGLLLFGDVGMFGECCHQIAIGNLFDDTQKKMKVEGVAWR